MALFLTLNPVGSSQGPRSSSAIARNGDQGKGWQLTHTFTKAEWDASGNIWFLVPYGARSVTVTMSQSTTASTPTLALAVTTLSHDELESGTQLPVGIVNTVQGTSSITGGTFGQGVYSPPVCTAIRPAIGGTGNVGTDSYTVTVYAVCTIRA